ncbi:hypothetical protein [Pedobacter sp. WC2423]|uniref:hypothetical protein n=1 Tax=Pedobacter sp. WC2423 TaxID=3234142 RepID=UPI003465101F
MSWKRFVKKVRFSFIMLSRQSFQEAAIFSFMTGRFRREWKDAECEHVEVITIKIYNEIAEAYEVSIVKSKLVIHNEQMVYTKQPDEWLAIYDTSRRQLIEVGGTRTFTFFPDENEALLDKHGYVKVE